MLSGSDGDDSAAPEADRRDRITGMLNFEGHDGAADMCFWYDVVRLWEIGAATLMGGGLATLPLALVSRLNPEELPGMVERARVRLRTETDDATASLLWTGTYFMMGMYYQTEFIVNLLKRVDGMRESSTFQATLEEGAQNGRRKALRDVLFGSGLRRLGESTQDVRRRIEETDDNQALQKWVDSLFEAESWDEVMARA